MQKSTAPSGSPARSVRGNPRVIVVAGPSGSGKTTLGRALAAHLGWAFEDADDYHAPEAVAKMGAGKGLTDADRAPWLDRLAALIQERATLGPPTVLSCSALTRAYRERLTRAASGVALVWLAVPEHLLRQRLTSRPGHFAGAALLPSQLATVEPLASEEGLALDGSRPLTALVREVAAWV
ncbi:gluconokinase [Rubricoccus marinus]|uniref:Gluconokinase n=1 Tax=Rubricoccus marinus TaxID=716817 RepID=A0A259TWU7_9BACT|nr:gluconokinase, GntK/IdnK-type [Rubricoccus marinus]OZC02223.1 hypothetical protein BSZ36_04005 [Rubricoccus marinus]